jgi:hypothetical protein
MLTRKAGARRLERPGFVASLAKQNLREIDFGCKNYATIECLKDLA